MDLGPATTLIILSYQNRYELYPSDPLLMIVVLWIMA